MTTFGLLVVWYTKPEGKQWQSEWTASLCTCYYIACIPSGFAGTGVCESPSWKAATASKTAARTVRIMPSILEQKKCCA